MSRGPVIGTIREGPLHAALKGRLARLGDRTEVRVEGFVIDLVRPDGELVEIQVGAFSPLARKLDALLDAHRIRIVHPLAAERRIVRVDEQGVVVGARRSPLRDRPLAIFEQLVSFPSLLAHPNLTIELILCREDHIRSAAPVHGRRFARDPGERRLVDVLERVELCSPLDALALVPLPEGIFTNRNVADAARCPLRLAQRVTYCLRHLGLLEQAGSCGRAPLFRRVPLEL